MKKKFRFRFQAITSTISSMLVLVLIGMTILCTFAARNISSYMCENYIVTLTLGGSNDAVLGTDEGFSSQTALMQQNLQSERYVKAVKLISANEVLQQQLDVIGGNPEEFLGFNPYYSEFEVELQPQYVNTDSLQRITKDLTAKYPLISDITFEKDLMENLNTNIHKLTFVLLAFAGLLLIVLFTLINNMVRLSIYARRFHIHTMKLVGATYWFIRRPFMIRSLWIGLAAGILANIVLVCFMEWIFSCDETYRLFLGTSELVQMMGIVILIGIVILALCTLISVNHFLSMKEEKMHW